VDHAAITVKDMTRSITFYTEKLGFTITRSSETPSMKTVFVGKGQVQLELFALKQGSAKAVPEPQRNEIGIKHIAFNVTDLDTLIKEFKEKGVVFISEIRQAGTRRHIFFKDPDGITLQLLEG
jgi:catechol 2,3-dioxygenase-like lactoylglutathione lyase family enzyme